MDLSAVDLALLGYLGLRLVLGLLSGFIFGLLHLGVMAFAIVAALLYSDRLADMLPWLDGLMEPGRLSLVAALLIYLVIGMVGRLALRVVAIWAKPGLAMMPFVFRASGAMLGGVLGAAQGAVSLAFFLVLASYLDVGALKPYWEDSKGLPILTVATVELAGSLPDFGTQMSHDLVSMGYDPVTRIPFMKFSAEGKPLVEEIEITDGGLEDADGLGEAAGKLVDLAADNGKGE